ncbi:MAG: cupredoxin domain-containing protein [Acidimicrobiales bacterium]
MTTATTTTHPRSKVLGLGLRALGAGLLATTGSIHLDLYLTGYRHIPTIGTLFLLQVVAAFGLALATIALGRRVVALAGAGFVLSTLSGYIFSLWIGLFGFNEVRTTAGIVAGVVEIVAFVVLGSYGVFLASESRMSPSPLWTTARRALGPAGVLAMFALVLALANSPGVVANTSEPPSATGSASTTSIRISIKNFEFIPAQFTVAPGAKIIITNHDSVPHTFTAAPGSFPQGTFNSGNIAPGQTVTVTAPTMLGSYNYYCAIHNYMTGTFDVR